MKEFIKKFLLESLGVQNSIAKITPLLREEILNNINYNFNKINNGDSWELISQIRPTAELTNDLAISLITFNINFTFSDKVKITGLFKENKVKLIGDAKYSISIELNISTNNLNEIISQIDGAISHELNHAFTYIKKINKISKASELNKVKNKTNIELYEVINNEPFLKEFMRMVYLSLPDEVNARVQQTYSELKHINSKDYNETLESLLKFKPLNQAKAMINYKLDNIETVDIETLKIFINAFNKNKIFFSNSNNTTIINDIDLFLKKWKQTINNSGHKLLKKIMKLVADKHNIHENLIFNYLDIPLYQEISGLEILN